MEDWNNWDLEAVVRFACRLSPPAASDPFSSFPPPLPSAAGVKEEVDAAWHFPDLSSGDRGGSSGLQELDELYKAFVATPPLAPPPPQPQQPVTPRDVPHQTAVLAPAARPQQQRTQPSSRQVSGGGGGVPRSKRRKNQQKKVVCHVPADGVSADVWAWRKYGQKPIKGSPYPRGYYRCSSSKGCMARKQVERSRTDPNTFIITYTAEHNHPVPTHRNSLAGSTRQKFPAPAPAPAPQPASTTADAEAPAAQRNASSSPPSTSAGLSPTTPLNTSSMDGEAEEEEEDEEEEGMLLVEDMEMVGEDELLFLKPETTLDGSSGRDDVTAMAALFDDPDEPFFNAPWMGGTGETAAAASGGS